MRKQIKEIAQFVKDEKKLVIGYFTGATVAGVASHYFYSREFKKVGVVYAREWINEETGTRILHTVLSTGKNQVLKFVADPK